MALNKAASVSKCCSQGQESSLTGWNISLNTEIFYWHAYILQHKNRTKISIGELVRP